MKDFVSATAPKQFSDAAALLYALLHEPHDVPQEELPSKCISPSCLECQVYNAWKMQGIEPLPAKESFQSQSFADAGTDRHLRIQGFLSKTEYWVDIEKYIKEKGLDDLEVVEKVGPEVLLYSKKYNARFRLDGLLCIENEYYVLEIKTERQAANSFRVAPEPKHVKQGTAYAMMLNTKGILWLYEGRDFLEQRVILQPISEDDKKRISDYMLDIIGSYNEPYMLSRNTKMCVGCAYKNYCKMYFNEYEKKQFLERSKK
jgi:CRISPR/Cas system-associated exonuclease Cas4 (RecB family)